MKREPVHFDSELFIFNGVYYYRGTPFGLKKRIERSLGINVGAAQKDVLKKKKELVESVERLGSTHGRATFEVLAERYKSERKTEAKNPDHLSSRTLKETLGIMDNHLVPFFGTERIEEMSQNRFIAYCKFKQKAAINLVNHRKILAHFLKWCVHNDYLKYRPEIEIPKFAKKDRRKREILTDDEIKNLLAKADGKALLYIGMYLLMGMRNMEICALKWDDISFAKGALRVNPMNNRTRKSRVIPINPWVIELLIQAHTGSDSLWVFPSRKSTGKCPHMHPAGGIRKPWAKALTAAGITRHLTPHDMRSTFETFMHKNTAFTDTQREKMAGAQIDVQKNVYVTMTADDLRGLESAVNVPGLNDVMERKIEQINGGKSGGKSPLKRKQKTASV